MTATATAQRPLKLEDSAEHREAQTILTRLEGDQAARLKRHQDIETAFAKSNPVTSRDRDAGALIQGKDLDDPAVNRQQQRESMAHLRREIEAGRVAIEMQRRTLRDVDSRASQKIAEGLVPEHRKLVRTIAEAAVALTKACAAEKSFRDVLAAQGIEYLASIRPMNFRNPGDLGDHQSYIAVFLRECVEFGFLDAKDPLVKGTAAISGAESFMRRGA